MIKASLSLTQESRTTRDLSLMCTHTGTRATSNSVFSIQVTHISMLIKTDTLNLQINTLKRANVVGSLRMLTLCAVSGRGEPNLKFLKGKQNCQKLESPRGSKSLSFSSKIQEN